MRFIIKLWVIFVMSVTTVYAADLYQLDNMHSYVEWHINHFGFSSPSGKWFVDGKLTLDTKNLGASHVEITIPIAALQTGLPKLDEHLLSPEFFDAHKFPSATFTSAKVVLTGKNTANIVGMLDLHGVKKPLTLHVSLNKMGISEYTKKPTVGFTAHTTLNRSDYGIKAYLPGLADVVTLDIQVEASVITP